LLKRTLSPALENDVLPDVLIEDDSPRNQGDRMKTHFARIATAIIGFAALAICAKAQERDQVVVDVPYEFVVSGKTLPAGTYRLNRVDIAGNRELLLRSVENAEGVLVVPGDVEDARDDKPSFRFQEIGGEHFLTQIETVEHVFALQVSKSAVLEATMKSRQDQKSSGAIGAH
jgi:hypothetical protein